MNAEAFARLHRLCFGEQSWDQASFERYLGDPAIYCETLGQEEAFIVIQMIAPEAEILSIGVAPFARRRGYAERLLQKAELDLGAMGIETLYLEVADDNGAALALYRAQGFECSGRRKGYYRRSGGLSQDALLMKKAIV